MTEIVVGLRRSDSLRARQAVHGVVYGLRRKIERDPAHPEILLNEARVGFRLAAQTWDSSANDATPLPDVGARRPES